ncbi:AzlD domain-containing protein [Lampropedia puyangensis]|uniref:AzlD domain-containing protein n=1 Tax=Lampropedia puyangensis TaxID=1330072 RepID=A0A4S8F6L5_9BURK|nr:AzlD domain-containing protein [Lampropedia puyangensis]THU02749.1 AzlD domain-containing protein [Lampropedia puyangensis]
MSNDDWWVLSAIIGLTIVTVITRGFFMFPNKEIPLPTWLKRGLKYAPLAALAAVIIPEIVTSNGSLIATWQDARLYAVPAACAYYFWRQGILGTILAGMAVYLPLRLLLGW